MKLRIATYLLVTAFFIGSITPTFSQSPEQLFQKGLVKEEGEGALNEAINIYNKIVDNQDADKSLQAKALLHVGQCYEKLGKNEATKAYQRLVNNFPGQKNEVAIARERLSRLILAVEEITKTPLTPKFIKIKIPTKLSWSVKLSPDGKELALVSDKKLWKMPLSGNLGPDIPGTPVQVNTNGIEVEWSGLDWSRDGKWIAFNDYPKHNEKGEYIENQSIFIVPAGGGESKKLIENYRSARVVNYRISLSPNAKKIAFSSIENNKQHIFSTDIGNISPKQITEMEAREPVFSPDGKYIAFVKDKNRGVDEGDLGLWVVSTQGGSPNKLADAGKASSPVWSPDGKMIAFLDYSIGKQINIVPLSSGKSTGKVISIEAPEGTEEVRLLAGWTPDNKIGALLASKIDFGLYTLPANGGQAAMIMNDTRVFQPRWSRDSKQIYYVTQPLEGDRKSYRQFIASVPCSGGKGKPLKTNINGKSIKQFGFQSGNRVSPDGKWIVTSTWTPADTNTLNVHWPTSKIWKVSVDGDDAVQITNSPGNFADHSPCWSPDGKKVAFVRFQLEKGKNDIFGGTPKIYSISSQGGEPELLVSISGNYVNSVIWSPDGRTIAYLTKEINEPHTKNLNLYDVETKESRTIGNIESANVNNEMAWSPDSKRIAINDGEGKVIKIITLTDESTKNINTGLVDVNVYHLDWSSDGERFVFGGWKGGEAEFWFLEDFMPFDKLAQKTEKESFTIRKVIDGTGAGFVYGNPSPDGKYFAFVDWSTSPCDILIKETGTEKEICLRNQTDLNYEGDTGTPYFPIWSPDSKKIAYTWENNKAEYVELRVIKIDNPKPDVLIRVSFREGWVQPEDWSPDGKHILVNLTKNNQVQLGLISIEGGSFNVLKKTDGFSPTSAKFSPDGLHIAYDLPPNNESANHDIYVFSIDGKRESKLTSHPSHDYLVDWTPSGMEILFASDRTGTTDMWSIPIDEGTLGGKPKLIKKNVGLIMPLGSTGVGSLYFSTPGSWWDIYTVTIDPKTGKVTTPPTEVPLPYQGYNRCSAWSPDGKYLAFVSDLGELRRPNILYIYTKKTGSSKEFIIQKDANFFPRWFPDSQSILVNHTDVLKIATGEITPFIQLEEEEEVYSSRISSNNKYIYYAIRDKNWKTHNIIRWNLESGEEKELYRTIDANLTMALSPDGKQLAIMSLHNKDTRILKILSTMESSEKDIYTYKHKEFGYKSIAWSPDGKYIYFSKRTGSVEKRPDELCRIPAAGGDVENLGVNMLLFTDISIHPDGRSITFASFVGLEKPGRVWVMENFLPNEETDNRHK